MSPLSHEVSFNFDTCHHVCRELQKCSLRCSPEPPVSTAYLEHLNSLAGNPRSPTAALHNARYLATGSTDLVVLLLEPSDKEETHAYGDMAIDDYPPTIQILDASLRLAFNDRRSIENTIILDSRPLRFRRPRQSEPPEERNDRDAAAYRTLNKMLSAISPKVIVVCQCDKDGDYLDPERYSRLGLQKYLCSSVQKSGTMAHAQMADGHECVVVYSYHPMYIMRRGEDATYTLPRRLLFEANLFQAANALRGRTMTGQGMSILQYAVRNGCPLPDAISRYLPFRPDECSPDEVIEAIEKIMSKTPLEKCLRTYRTPED